MDCSKLKCQGIGVWHPILVLKAKNTGAELQAPIDVAVCEMHRDLSKLEDFLSPEGWDKIQKHLRECGKGDFVKRSTRLDWKRTEDAPPELPF